MVRLIFHFETARQLTLLEPAQQRASEALLSKALIGLVSSPQFEQSRAFLGYVCRLLDLLITKRKLKILHIESGLC
jgi:hypothetical protein